MRRSIIVISTISPEREGRLASTLELLNKEYDITLVSPSCGTSLKYKHIEITEKRPVGIIEQLWFLKYLHNNLKKFNRMYDIAYIANFMAVPAAKILLNHLEIDKVVYDAYEVLFLPKSMKAGYKRKVYLAFERAIIKKADLVIEANRERALLVQGYYQLDATPVFLRNVNINRVDKVFENVKNVDGVLRLCYLGFVSKERGIFELVDEISKTDKIQLDIYGIGNDSKLLENRILEKDIPNIKFHGSYQLEEIESILLNHDIGYIFYPNEGYNNIYCEPNKVFDYAYSGVPMVSYRHPKLDELFQIFGIGISSDSIIEAVFSIGNNINYYRQRCRDFYVSEIDRRATEEVKFLMEIRKLCGK